MKDINKAILLGRLGADPILRHTRTGTPVTHFSMATSRRFYSEKNKVEENKKQEDQTFSEWDPNEPFPNTNSEKHAQQLTEETQWHHIVVWGKQGEACFRYLKKGQPVYVEGFFRSSLYIDKNGSQKLSTEIQAETISFLSFPPEAGQNPQPSQPVE